MEIRPRPLNQRQFLFVFFLFLTNVSLGQLVRFDDGSFSVGIRNGSNPNYNLATGKVFFVGTWDQSLSIKGIPLKFSSRISDEPLRAGRPTYFKLAYQPLKRDIHVTDSLVTNISTQKVKKLELQDSLYVLEQKLAFLEEMTKYSNHDFNYNFDLNDSLNAITQINNIELDSVQLPKKFSNEWSSTELDLNSQIKNLSSLISGLNSQINSVDSSLLSLTEDYKKLKTPETPTFLNGIRKFDVGMTALSPAWGGTNALPIQGIRVKGKVNQWNYDLSTGFSVTSRLFASNAIDQIINNSVNNFNATQFFAVSQSRFTSAASFAWGSDKALLTGIENFYGGRTFDAMKKHISGNQSLSSNYFIQYTFPFIKQLTLGAKIGGTYLNTGDTINRSFSEKSLQQLALKWTAIRTKTFFSTDYRKIGKGYTSWTQGIYINGFEELKGSLTQYIGTKLQLTATASETRFGQKDSILGVSLLRSVGLNGNYTFRKSSLVYGNLTVLSSDKNQNLNGENYNYLLGVKGAKSFKKMAWENGLETRSFRMKTSDSVQRIDQTSIKTGLRFKIWHFAVKGVSQYYSGIERLVGNNAVGQLEVGVNVDKFKFTGVASYSNGEQFGEDFGCLFDASFSPSTFFTWKLSGQRWLKSELAFFNTQPSIVNTPWYFSTSMIITLKK